MDKNRVHAIIANAVESGGSFGPIDRVKFVQFAKMHGIEYSVIEEVIDIGQALHLVYRHKDRLDASDLPREQKKAMRADLQKSIDEKLEALKSIRNSILVRDRLSSMWSLLHENWLQEILKNKNNI
ncbi:hypothetical protein [Helicobacter pylori]|uniref:hypothetical protein n=1 Tax=Helicobacter pylori TaxID=210 RepID=UPI000D38F0B7|nr:hypothetical protein [Helicobacter pylori]PUD83377.1 hypothetical protein C2R48_06470 [Helicobacter pylori]